MSIPALALIAVAALLDTTKPADAVCPVDGTKFKATEVVWTNASLAWGGEDADFCRHAFDTLPMENYIWTCPTCYYSGSKAQFLEAKLTDDQKKKLKGALKPAVAIPANAKQEQIPGWVKYDLLAQVEALKDATSHVLGRRHLNAAWAARQSGAVRLNDYDDWMEASKSAGFERSPWDLGKKNRADEDLAACRKLERDVTGGKFSGTGLLLRKHLLAYNYRRRGEFADAVRWLDDLEKSKGENSIVDDAAKKMRDSIAIEREQLKKAAVQFAKAVDDPALDASSKAENCYMLGEIARRTGDAAAAKTWYDKAMATTSSDALKKKAEAQKGMLK